MYVMNAHMYPSGHRKHSITGGHSKVSGHVVWRTCSDSENWGALLLVSLPICVYFTHTYTLYQEFIIYYTR